MRKDKIEATKLRLQGFSYNQINKKLGVPKSTLSGWFKDLQISKEAQEKINKRRHDKSFEGILKSSKLQTKRAQERVREERSNSKKDIKSLSKRELLILGTALYWGEGYKRPVFINNIQKTHHSISLSNSDPELAKIFIRFLEEVCEISRKEMKASVRIYEHMNKEKVLKFWQEITNIPKENFRSDDYISKASKGKRFFNRLPYGTIQINANNTRKFHKIMGWIDGLKDLS